MTSTTDALLYRPHTGPAFVSVQTGGGKKFGKPVRSMSTCCPSSSYEALRYAVAALNRLDDFNCEKIGAGFFSEVFKVTHRTTGQVMVLKMNTSLSNRANMLREVQLMNRLSHDNILRFMGVCVHEGQLHALTEYINGGSLEQLLQSPHLELSWETRIKLSLDIARGMGYLHSRGVFHRDLTSKNVLIKINKDEMTAVVGDFGLAEKIPDSRDRSQRLPIVGSPYWMAPECLKGAWYNNKADVFSYGIILCEIIARIEADPDILPRTENFGVDYVAFSDMCPDCPPQYLELAFTSCRIEPDSRPTFKEIVHQLEKMLNVISSMSGGSNLFYPPVVYTSCWDDGDSIDSVRAIFAHGWNKLNTCHNKIPPATPIKVSSSVPQTPVTPKHVGEAMSMCDPHYKPYNSSFNPFASLPRFWKGKKFLLNEQDLSHSMHFGLPSPCDSKLQVPLHPLPSSSSKSLPTSPVLRRKLPALQTLYGDMSDSPRSVSPGQFSPPSSMSPFEPEDHFSEQMSDCRIDDDLVSSKIPEESRSTVALRPKTLSGKLRRSSGESGFFSVGDRSSTCDLSLEGFQGHEDLTSWTMEGSREANVESVDGIDVLPVQDDCHPQETNELSDSSRNLTSNGTNISGSSLFKGSNLPLEDISSWTLNSKATVEVVSMDLQTDVLPVPETLSSHPMQNDLPFNDHHIGGRKRPSSCYSDDSCCCCHQTSSISEYSNKDSDPRDSESHVCHVCSFCKNGAFGDLSSQGGTAAYADPVPHPLSKVCDKGKRIAKCMRTSTDY